VSGVRLKVLTAVTMVVLGVPATAGAVPPTTEQSTIDGDPAATYSGLTTAAGWSRVVRDELAAPGTQRAKKRRSLTYFAQLSDFQLADEESPKRVEFLDISGTPFTAAWRPHEAFGPFIVDQAVRQVRDFAAASPVRGAANSRARMDLALTTGDNADNAQHNEVSWVVKLLEGGTLNPNSGIESPACPSGLLTPGEAARYTGVQDYDDYPATDAFYDPDEPTGRWSAWPNYPGLMNRAQQPFTAAGLNVPSYIAMGNHDSLTQGNAAENAGYEAIGTGCVKPMAPVPLADLQPAFLATMGQTVAVPPDPARRAVNDAQYRALHDTGHQADAHGFALRDPAEDQASAGAANYYSFSPRPGIRLISVDTVSEAGVIGPSADGNIDHPQFTWIASELAAADAAGELVILFGHHPIRSLTADFADELAPPCTANDLHGHDVNPGCDNDPRDSAPIHLGPDLQDLLLAHRNVIAYVAGHTHEHKITPFERPEGGGFWGIETSAEIDWPVQSRLIEVMDNRDGTLSIFGTLLDHSGPIATPASGSPAAAFSPATVAAIGRELAYNDPQGGAGTGVGTPADRNVELLLPDPR
jgi:metallophosphoesterase (TIGR03767 family)